MANLKIEDCAVTESLEGSIWVNTNGVTEGQVMVHDGTDFTFADATDPTQDRLERLENIVEQIADRLAIIVDPDPEKMEQFETLKEAYNKYKFVDKLCGEKKEEE